MLPSMGEKTIYIQMKCFIIQFYLRESLFSGVIMIRKDRNACPMFNALRNRGSRIHKSIARITPQRKLIFYVFMIQTRMPMNQFISYQFIV